MPTTQTVNHIVNARTWDQRVARIRQIPGRHATDEHSAIYAEIARRLYVTHLAPRGTAISDEQAQVAAETISQIPGGTLFGTPPTTSLKSKQDKPDTASGWDSVRLYAEQGVPYSVFLHQRHYGGAFRQVLDATSELRGDLIEDAVEALFTEHGILISAPARIIRQRSRRGLR
ncbi:MAG: hypothetical protein ACRDNZ_09460 [Streptosporangiaceae bacterium]